MGATHTAPPPLPTPPSGVTPPTPPTPGAPTSSLRPSITTSSLRTPTTTALNSTTVETPKKSGGKIALFVILALVFFAVYGVFWMKLLNYPLPF
jgi:hypothetical protein